MKWTLFLERESTSPYGQNEFMNELYRKMFIVAFGKVHNKADALDVVQESWIKIIEKIDSLKDQDKLVQWARVIVSNTALNAIKKKQILGFVPYDFDQLMSNDPLIDIEIEDRFTRSEILDSIEQLDEQTRMMFIRKYYHGWGDKQISEDMDVPIGTVKSRMHRGRERLRVLLSDELIRST